MSSSEQTAYSVQWVETYSENTVLYEKDFTKLESAIHESTYKLFMHVAWMDMWVDNGMRELELRKSAMIEARNEMHAVDRSLPDIPEDDTAHDHETKPLPSLDLGGISRELIMGRIRCIKAGNISKCIAVLTYAALIAPTAAMDDHLVLERAFAVPGVMEVHQVPRIAIGTLTGMMFLCGGYLVGAARSLVGPLMGITSVLYFMMRNDAAVAPVFAWA
jgi:hypothetical protein